MNGEKIKYYNMVKKLCILQENNLKTKIRKISHYFRLGFFFHFYFHFLQIEKKISLYSCLE